MDAPLIVSPTTRVRGSRVLSGVWEVVTRTFVIRSSQFAGAYNPARTTASSGRSTRPPGFSRFQNANVNSSCTTGRSFCPFNGPKIASPVTCCHHEPSLVVAHDEVLVIDPGQMKVKCPAVYCRLPHQTGVT